MALEIRQLRYMVQVADRESFSRAAERLGVAQPALSQQILKIERDLGFDLFARHPRGASVTPAGEAGHADPRTVACQRPAAGPHLRAHAQHLVAAAGRVRRTGPRQRRLH
jgi:Bacterial regulatory helix-turn-helix protein, lysR family